MPSFVETVSGQMLANERLAEPSSSIRWFLHLMAVWGHLASHRDFKTRWSLPTKHANSAQIETTYHSGVLEMVASGGHISVSEYLFRWARDVCVAWTSVARTGADVLLSWTFRRHGRLFCCADRASLGSESCQAKLKYLYLH